MADLNKILEAMQQLEGIKIMNEPKTPATKRIYEEHKKVGGIGNDDYLLHLRPRDFEVLLAGTAYSFDTYESIPGYEGLSQAEMLSNAYDVLQPLCVSNGEFPFFVKKVKTYEQACAVAVMVKLSDEAWNYTHPTTYCEIQHAVLAERAVWNVDMSPVESPMITAAKMDRLGSLIGRGVDITQYLIEDITAEQLDAILYGLNMGVDPTIHVKAGVNLDTLWNVLFLLKHQPELRKEFTTWETLELVPGMRRIVGEYHSIDEKEWVQR